MAFDLGNGSIAHDITMTCQWNQTWLPTDSLLTCICKSISVLLSISQLHPILADTHCDVPPTPAPSYNLDRNWDGNLVEFNTKINYTCSRGMKFKDDFNIAKQEALCLNENFWVEPPWLECVESVYL